MSIIELEKKYLFQTYKRNPVVFIKGKRKYLWDIKGKKYLDFFSGVGVSSLGHSHPLILKAIKNQTEKFIHISNLYYAIPQIELAKKLSELSFGGKVFFSNSGGEANECAIKLARKWGQKQGRGKYEIISFENSFHGRTIATISCSGQKKFQKGFKPLLKGFRFAEFNNLLSVKKLINKKTVAIIVEPVQGEGGVNIATKEFLKGLRVLCDKHKLLLIFDEVQCGIGRTGELFAYKNFGVIPEVMTLAKALAGGLPLGATIAKKEIASVFGFGDHGSTFGGNPVACASALEVLKIIDEKLLKNVKVVGNYFLEKLNELKFKYNFIKDVRGLGLMIGIELSFEGKEIVKKSFEKGLLINCTRDNVLRFLPPLFITKEDVDYAVSILDKIFMEA